MLDIKKIRKDFPMFKNNPELIYFDSGATSYKPQIVIDRINSFYTNLTSNIHRGDYDISFDVSKQYDEARNKIAKFLNVDDPRTIVYTHGDTESLNLVAYSYGLANLKKDDVILTTEVEHASNILPWFVIAKKVGARIEYIPLNEDASFDLEKYQKCFENKNVKLVNITHVSNVMGYVYPIKEIVKIAHENKAIVNVDGAQAAPHIKVDLKDLDVDFYSFSGHKMLGPSGIGILYGKYELLNKMEPLYYGGGANARFDNKGNIILKEVPEKFEAGTPNIEGVLGLDSAIEYLESIGMEKIEEYQKDLTKYFVNKLSEIENVKIYNPNNSSSIVSFNVEGIFAQDVASYLNYHNIAVRTGNHCAKILYNIIGASETVRCSLYFYNTYEEVDKFIEIIKDITLEKCLEILL